jgi:phage terminase small subunit
MSDEQPQLNDKQRLFIAHYVQCWNATEAARKAGYSEKTANEQGARLLANVSIRAEIDQRLADIMPKGEILYRLAEQARGTIEDFFRIEEEDVVVERTVTVEELNDDPEEKPRIIERTVVSTTAKRPVVIMDLKRAKSLGAMHLLKKYKKGRDGESIELHDPQAALVQLGKYHGLWIERQEVTGKDGGPVEVSVSDARERLLERITRRATAASAGRDQSGDPGT